MVDQILDFAHFHYKVASRSVLSTVNVWGPLGSSRELSHDSEVLGVKFLPGGDKVLTFGQDPVAVIWDVADGKQLHELPHRGPVECGAVFPDGRRVITCAGEATRIIWDAESGKQLHVLRPPVYQPPNSRFGFLTRGVSVFPGGERVLVWGLDHWATIWNATSGEAICELTGHSAPISTVAVFPGGDRLITGGFDRNAIIWDVATCGALRVISDLSWLLDVVALPSGDKVATLTSNGRPKVWDASTGEQLHELTSPALKGKGLATGMQGFPHEDKVVTFGMGEAVVWDAGTGEILTQLRAAGSIYNCAVSPNGFLLAVCGSDRVALWDLASGAKLHEHEAESVPRPPNACPVDIGPAADSLPEQRAGPKVTWRSMQ